MTMEGLGRTHRTPARPRTHAPKVKTAKPHSGSHAKGKVTHPTETRAHASIQAFDSGTYTATIALARSPGTTISGVPVSRAISSGLLTAGSTVAVVFFSSHDSADSMIVGVH